jgi:DNA excision repair protein ERCC-6
LRKRVLDGVRQRLQPAEAASRDTCRLITRGAIEEKVYHRQIYKHALSTRILNDPRQKRYVASRDVRDLFSLSDRQHGNSSETGRIFKGVSAQVTAADVADSDSADVEPAGVAGGEVNAAGAGAAAADDADAAQASARAGKRNGQTKEAGRRSKRNGAATPAQTPPGAEVGAAGEAGGDDTLILRELFGGDGLHSALNHAAIEASSDPARRGVEENAAKVAARAIAALRESRAAVRRQAVSTCAACHTIADTAPL